MLILLLARPAVSGSIWIFSHQDKLRSADIPSEVKADTMKGQDIIVDEYGMGSFLDDCRDNGRALAMVAKLEKDIEAVFVKDVLPHDDVVADISLPVDMIPQDLRDKFFKGDARWMLAVVRRYIIRRYHDGSRRSDPSTVHTGQR